MSKKITGINRQHRGKATKPEFLVTKDEMLTALVSVSFTISSP